VTDVISPWHWEGTTAFKDWMAALATYCTKHEDTDLKFTPAKPLSQALTSAVEHLVTKLISVGPIAVMQVKRCFACSRDVDIDTAAMFENEAATKCFVSADQQEGLRAFLEKRNPRWSNQ
jgi:enoyl-CoA hydratase/carnithine racemase